MGDTLPVDIAIHREPPQLNSAPFLQGNILAELSASSSSVEVVPCVANTLLKRKPLQKCRNLLLLQGKVVTFSPQICSAPKKSLSTVLLFCSAQPCSIPECELLNEVFQLSPLRNLQARFVYSALVNEDCHSRLSREKDLFVKEKSRRVPASTRGGE